MLPTSTDVQVTLKRTPPADADAIAVLVHKQTKAADLSPLTPANVAKVVGALMTSKLVTGKSNEVNITLLGDEKDRRLIVIGLGNHEKFSCECLREAGGVLAKQVRKHKLKSVGVIVPRTSATLPGVPDAPPAGVGEELAPACIANGFLLGSFSCRESKGTAQKKDEAEQLRVKLTLIAEDTRAIKVSVDRAVAMADAQNFARTIASRPGNVINPPSLAKVAQQLAKEVGLSVRVLDERQMAQLGMGGILAVGAGSSRTPPRMIVLEHSGATRASAAKKKTATQASPLLVVGKAITFDTGGISIKPAEKMQRMIFDKCGGMAVLGLMCAVARLKLPIHVVGILASAENHISETAYRPGDVLRMFNGVTVEVTNTDAEGRLVLGDALTWGIETYKPSAVIDLATLTGGVITALGRTMAGVMSNSDAIISELDRASKTAGEKFWRLPLGDEQREQMKSDFADIVNSAGRDAHPLQGGAFLSYFVPDDGSVPWAHLDIAGVADTEKEQPFYTKGATGWGVRTLVEWVTARINGGGVNPEATQATPPPAGG
jgi:leucyl aminopeptidase